MRRLYLAVLCFPVVGLAMSLILAATLHPESATSTHCRVPNFWPSVSAATGSALRLRERQTRGEWVALHFER